MFVILFGRVVDTTNLGKYPTTKAKPTSDKQFLFSSFDYFSFISDNLFRSFVLNSISFASHKGYFRFLKILSHVIRDFVYNAK